MIPSIPAPRTLLGALALLLVAAAPVAAQSAATPSEIAAAEDLLVAMDSRETLAKTMTLMLAAQEEESPELAGMRDIMEEFFAEVLAWEEIGPEFVRLYTDLYTEEELRQLAAFYRSPVGRKVVETTPEVSVRSQQIANERVVARLPELMSRVVERTQQEAKSRKP